MEIKQHISKWPRGYWRNQNGNKKILETNDNENMTTQNLWDAAKAAKTYKREVYSNTILPLETGKTSNRQPNFTPKITV